VNAKAARLLEALAGLPHGAVVVEIGCARFAEERPSDGFSTVHLARVALAHGWTLHSVDSDPDAVLIARALTGGLPCTVHHSEGAAWLGAGPLIDGLYLDGESSPEQALAQYLAARLTPSAVVVVDDVQPIGDSEHGKGELLLSELEADGFTVEISPTEPGYQMAVATR
jgi:predicted O-methyltransferase YrrM